MCPYNVPIIIKDMLSNSQTIASGITYKPFGGMAGMTYGNNVTRTIGFDNQYRISAMQTGTMQDVSYAYDANGNITEISDNLNASKDKFYIYDALERLAEATGPWGAVNYTYDGVGNRQTEATDAGETNYTYSANKLMTSTGEKGLSFNYDSNGNTVSELLTLNSQLIHITKIRD
jgi:YD repeat-containing protein